MSNRGSAIKLFSTTILIVLIFSALPTNAGNGENLPKENLEAIIPYEIGEISLWEAYAKGYASIVSSSDSLAYIITNTGSATINVNEYVMILSPNPYEDGSENPTGKRWAQDGALTHETISPGDSVAYNYGDYVVGAYSPSRLPPPWWCTEDSEFTAPDVTISLSGEILPFDLWYDVQNPSGTLVLYDRGDRLSYCGETQSDIWTYLRYNAACVIGKTPLWKLIPNLPTSVDISIAVTNIGFLEADDLIVKDIIPSGFQLEPGSANPQPTSTTNNPDGSVDLFWNLGSLRGAIQTPDDTPTDYAKTYISYTLKTPELAPDVRYLLPRALVDKNNDGIMDAHSEEPLLETYFVNREPQAIVHDVTIDEGQTAYLDGNESYDPDEVYGDSITSYEWDLDGDGLTDETGQYISKEYGDDGEYFVTLKVTDSNGATNSTEACIKVNNVAPTVDVTFESQFVTVLLRVAGSKWSNVGMTLYEDEEPIGYIEVERWPGNPDNNPIYGDPSLSILFDRSRTYKAVITYDPFPDLGDEIRGDQPNNGKDKKDNAGNPVWVIFTSEDGEIAKIHHTFNTQQSKIKDSDHLNHVEPWEVDLNGLLSELAVALNAVAYDPGADDLSFVWEFNDGTIINHDYPNSGSVYPITVSDSVNYSGSASSVTLTVSDDDGGENTKIISL